MADQTLVHWLEHEYALSHDLQDSTITWYRSNLAAADRYAGQPLTLVNISDHIVNQLLADMLRAGRAPEYARGVRNAVAAIWRDAARAGICSPPAILRRIRCHPRPVRVWTPDQVIQLVLAAQSLPGNFRGLNVPRAPYFVSIIRMAWDSALRRRDLHRIRRRDVAEDFHWRQNKTRQLVRVRLRRSTLEAIDKLGRPPAAHLWPLWASDSAFGHTFALLVKRAGIPARPWKTIRKSAGTAAEALCPGAGHLLLGNSRRVFERYYLDGLQIAPPQPPELTHSRHPMTD